MEINNEEKFISLSHINNILTQAKIPHKYNVRDMTITLNGVDVTDALLTVHFYVDEYIYNLHTKINELEQQIGKMKCHANCKHQNDDSFKHMGGWFGCCEHWEMKV